MTIKLSFLVRKYILNAISKWQKFGVCTSGRVGSAILCYHDISKNKWDWSVTSKEFEKQVKYLVDVGKVVGVNEILSSRKSDQPRFAITFDDGYESVYKEAFPILSKYNLTACVFIIGGGKANDLLDNEMLMNKKQIMRLKKAGWEIGYHSCLHRNLRRLTTKDLEKELIVGKKRKENKLGINFRYFAYPFGKYSEKMVNTLKKAKFKAAFTVDGAEFSGVKKVMAFPRITVDKHLSLDEFKSLITKKGLLFNKFFTKILKIKDSLIE